MSIATLPDGRQICDTPGHQHQLRADAFHCAFNQTWKRLAEEARIEEAAAREEGMEAAAMEAREIELGDHLRLAPATEARPAIFAQVTSLEIVNEGTPLGYVKIKCAATGDELLLNPASIRWVRYVEKAA